MFFKLILVILGVVASATALHAARNRLLALASPRILKMVRRWVGEGADLAGLRLGWAWQLEIRGFRCPVGGGVQVEVQQAVVTGLSGLVTGRWRETLAVSTIEGTVCRVTPDDPVTAVTIPITYVRAATRSTSLLDGTVRVREASASLRSTLARPIPYLDLEARIEVGFLPGCPSAASSPAAMRWALEEGRGSWGEPPAGSAGSGVPTIALSSDGTFGTGGPSVDRLDVTIDAIDRDRFLILAGFLDGERRLPLDLPVDLAVGARLALEPDRAVRARIHATTPSSLLTLDGLITREGSWREARLSGRLSITDLRSLGLLSSAVIDDPSGQLALDTTLEGSFAEPAVTGTAYSPRLAIVWGPRQTHPVHEASDLTVRLRFHRRRLAWSDLAASSLGGRFTGAGEIDLTGDEPVHASRVLWEGVAIESIPTAPGGRRGLAPYCRAIASGEMRLTGRTRDVLSTRGTGSLVLDRPVYLFLRNLEPQLAAYCLPVPPLDGAGPCRSLLALAGGVLTFSGVAGRVEGMSFAGEVRMAFAGELSGTLFIDLEPPYLSRSPALGLVTTVTGSITVPVVLTGRVDAPTARVDLAKTLEGVLGNGAIGSSAAGVLGELGGLFKKALSEAVPPQRNGPPEDELDPIFARIDPEAGPGDPEFEHLIDRLVETGLSEEEIASRWRAYKRRQGAR